MFAKFDDWINFAVLKINAGTNPKENIFAVFGAFSVLLWGGAVSLSSSKSEPKAAFFLC